MLLSAEHRFKPRTGRTPDGSRWQSFVSVSVIGGIYLKVPVKDASEGEVIDCEFHSRISLERDSNRSLFR